MRYLLWLGIAAVALCIILVFVRYRAQRKITILTNIPTVEKDIRSHLPIGTPRATVEEYLTRHAIEHSYIEISKVNPDPELNHTEIALIRGASRTWLVRSDIQIRFKFDNQNRLTHYSLEEINTGP